MNIQKPSVAHPLDEMLHKYNSMFFTKYIALFRQIFLNEDVGHVGHNVDVVLQYLKIFHLLFFVFFQINTVLFVLYFLFVILWFVCFLCDVLLLIFFHFLQKLKLVFKVHVKFIILVLWIVFFDWRDSWESLMSIKINAVSKKLNKTCGEFVKFER